MKYQNSDYNSQQYHILAIIIIHVVYVQETAGFTK